MWGMTILERQRSQLQWRQQQHQQGFLGNNARPDKEESSGNDSKRRKTGSDHPIKEIPGEETSANSSKDRSTSTEVAQKPQYIHVRARRGQATDNHSLAERVRREKISQRMKYLQELVPGCNKITGKAGMLDEIINYVQCLQRQVKFLSMKLTTVNPVLDIHPDSFITVKEDFTSSGDRIPSDLTADSFYLPFNNNTDLTLSSPVNTSVATAAATNEFMDTYYNMLQARGLSSAWAPDHQLQYLHNVEYAIPSFQELLGANNPKMEV